MPLIVDAVRRLEAEPALADLARGFRAEIADPVWFLGRQWQLGEHQGEDASSPVLVQADLSHVPLDRFDSFWALIASCLEPTGRVFFVDDAYRTPDELIEGEASSTIRRRLNDGTAYRVVKVPHRPADLEQRLARLGWCIQVTPTSGPFYWGAGTAAREKTG